ncbi:uroporphyrinogen-III synthase [Actibacterium sp. XHP0104]|uniref:uroporphyrinogen-III synthase n=1 Tax=Actibacterium sp. XHP0104 TaxID=2984335 RepID=UPI0021E6EA97|nr:uroporphyrinogen-III synthase [Actibacterium sp. XHP0104]MCV2882137.1 uroporphyrinogen-III synthase [Actibacterium sp. XHP0104]
MTQGPTPIILTRPWEQGQEFAARLADVLPGTPVILSPVMRIEPLPADNLPEAEAVILSSTNAVPAVAGQRIVAYCVGPRTARAAQEAGLQAVDCGGDAEALVATLTHIAPKGRLLHLRGEHARGEICARLNAAGLRCDEQVVYRQVPQELSRNARDALAGAGPVVLPLFSPRSARLLSARCADARAGLVLVAISEAALQAWESPAPRHAVVAQKPNAEAMLQAITALFAAPGRLEG